MAPIVVLAALQHTAAGERNTAIITDHKVIKEPDVNQLERIPHTARNELIRLAGFGDAGRMVMGQDDSGGVPGQCLFNNFTRINGRCINCAPKQFVKGQHAMAVVKKQAAKYFMRPVTQAGQQKLAAIGG
jgi:hypothetical protein